MEYIVIVMKRCKNKSLKGAKIQAFTNSDFPNILTLSMQSFPNVFFEGFFITFITFFFSFFKVDDCLFDLLSNFLFNFLIFFHYGFYVSQLW